MCCLAIAKIVLAGKLLPFNNNYIQHPLFIIINTFLFGLLIPAAGLYYLAELVEEYTVMTAKIIRFLIGVCFISHLI